jgi:hypothetical protein
MEEMIELIVATGILLWYGIAFWAVRHEEELREIYRTAKELTDSILGEEKDEEKNE